MNQIVFLLALTLSAQESKRNPVLVELFTSEGCSSCPPADAVLMRLDTQQPVRGAEIIVLSEHVDYWNRLGWTDPFSSARFSERQRDYVLRFPERGAYTPQMVVNGSVEFIGSDERRARREIERAAAAASRMPIQLSILANEANTLTLQVDSQKTPRNSEMWLAITEAGLSNDVRKGENRGRNLSHTGVVRTLSTVDGPGKVKVKLPATWKPANLRVVVFVQDRDSRAIHGAASIPVAPVANSF